MLVDRPETETPKFCYGSPAEKKTGEKEMVEKDSTVV